MHDILGKKGKIETEKNVRIVACFDHLDNIFNKMPPFPPLECFDFKK